MPAFQAQPAALRPSPLNVRHKKMITRCFSVLGLLALLTLKCVATQDPLVGQWQVDGRVIEAIQIADREARASMSLPGRAEDASYLVSDTGETYIVAITQAVASSEPKCVEIRIRKADMTVLFRIRRESMTYEKFRATKGVREK